MQELNFDEIDQVNGAGVGVAVAVVVVALCVAALAVGVYNGYRDEKQKQAPK